MNNEEWIMNNEEWRMKNEEWRMNTDEFHSKLGNEDWGKEEYSHLELCVVKRIHFFVK